nr:hypothetical protein [Tanacetum cinerariifolium]
MTELLLEAKFPQALQTLCEKINKYFQEKQVENNLAEEQETKVSSQYWKPPIFYDDEESSIPLRDIISELLLSVAIAPGFLITDILIMEDEHLDTILETKSNKVIKSSVENLVPIPSESTDLTDYESKCDMPVCDDSSSKNKGLDDIVSIPPGKEIDHLDAIPDSVQSLLNRANSINFLIEEFVELNSEISDAIIESFSPSPIPVEDCDSLMGEIDIFLDMDGLIPPGMENDDYDLEGDVLFLNNYLTMILFPLPNDDDVYIDIEPDSGVITTEVVDDIFDNLTRELYVHVPNVLPTLPTLYLVFDTLPPFSSENEDKVFNPGIIALKVEKSPHL